MKKTLLMAATAVLTLSVGAANADPYEPYGSNPDHYYSSADHDGYYDRNGNYHHFDRDDYRSGDGDDRYSRSDYRGGGGYYYNADADPECRRVGNPGGTIAGAVAGGVIGGVASHGNGVAIAGGAVLGGLVGNALTSDVECVDRRYAYDSYYRGLNGDIGVRVDWRNDAYGDYGYFVPVREYHRTGYRCRDYRTVTYRRGREIVREGTACRRGDGQWYFG
jgi:surface antigen